MGLFTNIEKYAPNPKLHFYSINEKVEKLRLSCVVIYFILLLTSLCAFQVCLYFIYWEKEGVMCGIQLHQYY